MRVLLLHRQRRRRGRSVWVRPILQRREDCGEFHTLMQELRNNDPAAHQRYFRMSVEESMKFCKRWSQESLSRGRILEIPSLPLSTWQSRCGTGKCCNSRHCAKVQTFSPFIICILKKPRPLSDSKGKEAFHEMKCKEKNRKLIEKYTIKQ